MPENLQAAVWICKDASAPATDGTGAGPWSVCYHPAH